MNKTKFTNGEWTLSKSIKGQDFMDINAPDHYAIATVVVSMSDGSKSEELLSNAQCMAHAKEMYNLLLKFIPMDVDGNGDGDFIYNDGCHELGVEVEKLLAKARGES